MGFFKNLFQSKKQKQQAEKFKIGMAKTRHGVLDHIKELLDGSTAIGDDLFDELEDVFIMADIGVDTVIKIVGHLRERVELDGIQDVEELKEILIDELFKLYVKDSIVSSNLDIRSGRTNVILFVGVNGVGKTTTIAKVAHEYKQKGKSVMMVAGDTFRAGAIEQLRIWAERTGVRFFAKGEGSDPSSVMYDAISLAEQEGIDLVLCDTAGRLQNKTNLMKELEKVHRVIAQKIDGAPHETLLVIDATTGQNGLSQAKIFDEVTKVSGIVLTKLDGTAKGGIVLAIRDELDIPIKYVGLGEKMDDLTHFDIEEYIYGMFEGIF
jgi:fused signal recognition particle receptor